MTDFVLQAEPVRTAEERKAAEQQIFNLKEAFERLSRELGDMLRHPPTGILVQAVDDNVYQWLVKFSFPTTCQLGKVLTEAVHPDHLRGSHIGLYVESCSKRCDASCRKLWKMMCSSGWSGSFPQSCASWGKVCLWSPQASSLCALTWQW